MNTAGRFQSAKNLQPARSLRTPAQNRNGPGNYGLPLEQNNPYQQNNNWQQNNLSGGQGFGGYHISNNNNNNGYRTPSVASSPSSTNGFKGNNGFNNNNNGNGNGFHGSKGHGQRRHDVLRSPNTSMDSNCSTASSGSSVKEIPTIVTFSSTTLAVGTVHEVYISYVENGPKLFTVQLKAKENSLNQMMAALERIPLRNLTRKPTLGMACIARFSEDRVLYRALIMGINIDSCLVSYVDYGNTETVDFKNLYEIPQELLKHKVFSMRFTLSKVKSLEDSNADIAGLFSSLVMDKVLNLKVMPLEGPAFVQYCELYDNKENVFEKLFNLCKSKPLKYPAGITLDRGSSCMIIIRFIESCRQFYIQLLESVERFDKLMDQLAECCRKSSTFNALNVGDCCAACLSDVECYRAEVVSVASSKVKVRLVDYGNTITLEKNQIKRLPPKFVDEQPQVVECCLEGFQEISDDNLSTAQLEMLAENESGDRKQFRMVVADVSNGVAIVTLLDEAASPPLNISKRLLKLYNPAKFIKEQQAQQLKMNSAAASKPQQVLYTPPPVAVHQAPVTIPQAPPPHSNNPFHSTSIISEVPNLSQTSPSRMGESEVIDLTNDEWPGANAQPLGHHSSGYEQQHSYQSQSNTGNNRYRSGADAGGGRGPRDSHSSTNRDLSQSSASSYGGNNKKERFQRPDIPRFTKERNQTPYYIEHDDRCETNNNYEQQDKGRGGREKAAAGQRNNRYSGSDSGFNTQSGDRGNFSQESWKSSSTSIDCAEDYVPYDYALTEQVIPMNTKVDIKLSWWVSPEEFYVRMKDEEVKFEDMMKQIQKYYRNKPSTSDVPPVGSTVIARYQKHNTLYRAKVIKYNEMLGKFKVELVDCGIRAIVTGSELWKLERRFVKLPQLAIQCTLANIKINCEPKELQNKIDRYISNEQPIGCVFLDKSENKYLCDVETQGTDLKMALLKDNLVAQILTDVDLNRLKGQTLKLKLVEMKSLDQFRVKLQGNDAILNCRHVEHGAYQAVVEEIQSKWLDQYCFGHIEDVSSDERLILTLLIPPLSNQAVPTIVDMPILQSKFTVTVPYVYEVNCVYVQNTKWADEVGKLLDDMFDYYEKSGTVITNLQMNELCASKSSDGNWYRSKITCLQEIDNIEVLFVDYGNRERVKHEDLKVLEAQFQEYSAFAHKVYLPMACLNEGEDDKLKVEIANLTGQFEMELKVLDFRNDIWIVDIAHNDYSIVQALKDKQLVKDLDHEEIVNRKTAVLNESMEMGSADKPEEADKEGEQKYQKLEGFVSHVDNPNQLFIQMKADLDDLDQLQENLQIISQALPGLKDFSVDRYCIAPYSADDMWYRAKIIDSHDDLIIQFVDYGNTDVITSNKKHELKDVNDSLMKFKVYAKQCSLLVGPAAGKGWSEEASSILRDLEYVDVQFLVECRGINYINLKCNDRDLAEELIAKNLAERMQYVPSEQRCFTSHIESIQEFYLQLERDINPLDVMADYMAKFEEFACVQNPAVGSIYVAEFPDDNLWYRAKILQVLDGPSFEVFFIDYGNTSVVTNVRELEASIAELPPLCTKCILRLPDGVKSWSDEAEIKFKEIAAMGETVFTVKLHNPGLAATVELFLGDQNINDQLLDLCEKGAANVMNSSFYLNEEKTVDNSFPQEGFVHVSHVNSPADFYIQFKNSHDALKNMEELLMIKAAQSERLMGDDVSEGMLCLAYSKSYDKFHRAQVISKENHQYKVHLLDHGSDGFSTDLRQMPDGSKEMPSLAKRCCLETYSPENGEVLKVVQKRFLELVDSGRTPFSFEIVRNDVEPNIVRLFTEDGRNVEDLLELQEGDSDSFAMPTVAAALPPPAPSDLIKTSQRAKPKQAFYRAKSDLDFDQ
ncbi:maternal protein tudor [Aedes aegypti]|uniref:Tudor domain-containing protein n=1 Tax=Aedes aegypti TaxID=7159 RepID=A0A6I8TMY9_AEDAE|nr:maternal protein tudor [Aedes aegypti]